MCLGINDCCLCMVSGSVDAHQICGEQARTHQTDVEIGQWQIASHHRVLRAHPPPSDSAAEPPPPPAPHRRGLSRATSRRQQALHRNGTASPSPSAAESDVRVPQSQSPGVQSLYSVTRPRWSNGTGCASIILAQLLPHDCIPIADPNPSETAGRVTDVKTDGVHSSSFRAQFGHSLHVPCPLQWSRRQGPRAWSPPAAQCGAASRPTRAEQEAQMLWGR